ncbi:type IV pilus biogenesis/stability protein PilW [Aggregatibacter actinomycetemcomitans]|uniref:type IV pilus biogenesis/stability protein PilW n=1 Tax=Aggregatibacter actinomycetemcomitans TaxID=714 RepID=UPI001E3FBB77|nr:type IV pilus biogenesis/stability protein PilW [Aggregatibacter actinomycetemcomitans]
MIKFQQHNRAIPFIFPFLLSACVTQQSAVDFDKQKAAKARVELALGYLQQQDSAQAKLNLDKAFSYAPDYYLVSAAFAYFYQQQGDIEQARAAYLNAIKLDDKQGDVFNNYGAFLCAQGEFDSAYVQFERALKSSNYYHQADTYENLALCALSAKNQAIYRQNLALLTKISPKRAAKLPQGIK